MDPFVILAAPKNAPCATATLVTYDPDPPVCSPRAVNHDPSSIISVDSDHFGFATVPPSAFFFCAASFCACASLANLAFIFAVAD